MDLALCVSSAGRFCQILPVDLICADIEFITAIFGQIVVAKVMIDLVSCLLTRFCHIFFFFGGLLRGINSQQVLKPCFWHFRCYYDDVIFIRISKPPRSVLKNEVEKILYFKFNLVF